MLVLQVIHGPDRGRRFELPGHEPQLIGRSSEALPITDTTVSRRHAELTPDDGTWYVRDLDSANGTFVNGHRIRERVKVGPGDQIRCGSTLLLFGPPTGEDRRASMIRLLDDRELEVTVQAAADPNADSMILGAPDPVRSAHDHLRVIYELTALTARTLDRAALLERVLDLVFGEFKPDRGFILLAGDPSAPLEPAAIRYAERPRSVDEGRIPVSRTIIQHALERGEGVLSTNAMSDRRFEAGDSVRAYGIRSAICVPITAGDRRFGVIHIDSQRANFTFTEQQLQLLNAIGRHTGLAILSREHVETKVRTERLAAIGETVASISHSIKNILQGLRGGADAVELALKKEDLALAREGWPILARNLDRIFTLTLNMLAFSRSSSLDVELADVHALIREVAQLVERECDRKRVGLILDLADDMPPIPMDVNGVHQALMNVLVNAVEAAPPKRGVVTIKTQYHAGDHVARIAVSDNGPGIDPARHEAVFEAFSSTKGQRGTGLGLTVTRKIVTQHGGRVELESQPDRGTTIHLVLPAEATGMSAGETRLPRPLPPSELGERF